MFVNSQKILAGEMTGEQAGQNAQDVSEKWVKQNPDMVENYKTWAKDLRGWAEGEDEERKPTPGPSC